MHKSTSIWQEPHGSRLLRIEWVSNRASYFRQSLESLACRLLHYWSIRWLRGWTRILDWLRDRLLRFLKRATQQNIVIGGLAGAAPPLLGWTAVTNEIHGYALLLVLIIFAWTPPHVWALVIHRKDEYAKTGIPMLLNTSLNIRGKPMVNDVGHAMDFQDKYGVKVFTKWTLYR